MKHPSRAASAEIGLRERNKLDKLQRIQAAARELFADLGFDAATTRAIARRAGVGLGTLFNYADDKRDLVFLIFIEELDRITSRAFDAVDPRKPLLDQLVTAFAFFYRAFGANPVLSRILLQELTFYSHGRLAADFQRSRRRTAGLVERLVARAQQDRRVRRNVDAGLVSRSIFFIYSGAVRWWIAAEKPEPKRGIADLRKLLELHIAGLAPRAAQPRR